MSTTVTTPKSLLEEARGHINKAQESDGSIHDWYIEEADACIKDALNLMEGRKSESDRGTAT